MSCHLLKHGGAEKIVYLAAVSEESVKFAANVSLRARLIQKCWSLLRFELQRRA